MGPADGDTETLRTATEFLLTEAEVERAIYLGLDSSIDDVVRGWAATRGTLRDERDFLSRAAEVAMDGDPESIRALLRDEASARHLDAVRRIPHSRGKAVELIDDRVVMVVHDKAQLNEEDIANAMIVVYGKSPAPFRKQFGPRYFFTPGPLSAGSVGILEENGDGDIVFTLRRISGENVWHEPILGRRTARMRVTP